MARTFMMDELGAPYQGDILNGASIEFFGRKGSKLRVGIPNVTSKQLADYKGMPLFSMIVEKGELLSLWKFPNQNWLRAPFDVLSAKESGNLEIPYIGEKCRIVIELHVVDTKTGILEGIRAFTLTPEQTITVLSSVNHVLNEPENGSSQPSEPKKKRPFKPLLSARRILRNL